MGAAERNQNALKWLLSGLFLLLQKDEGRNDDIGSEWDGIEMPGLKSCTLIKLQPGLCWSMTVMINIKLGIAA